jgi:hypothetical protein
LRDEDAALRRDALGLELVQSLAQALEDREVAVHHRVDERIGEVVRAGGPEPAPARADAAAHALEHVAARPLLHGDDVGGPEEDAHLFLVDVGRQPEHPENDQVVVGVGLHLGALRDIEDVLHRERVEVQALAEPGHDLGLAEAVDIDPRDAGLVEKGDALVERHAVALDDVRRVVAHHADVRGLAPLRRRKRARRRARPKLGHAPATAEHAPDRHLLPLPRPRHDLRHSAEALRWLSSRRGLDGSS